MQYIHNHAPVLSVLTAGTEHIAGFIHIYVQIVLLNSFFFLAA